MRAELLQLVADIFNNSLEGIEEGRTIDFGVRRKGGLLDKRDLPGSRQASCFGVALLLSPRGASGRLVSRTPVALKMALPMAGAKATRGVSPAPADGISL